jgi:hypothetical protein
MGAAAFMLAITIHIAAREITMELCLIDIFISLFRSLLCRDAVDYINLVNRVRLTHPTI